MKHPRIWRWMGLAWLMASSLCSATEAAPAAPEAADPRLQAVLARLAAGQPITVVAIGGSITTGYAAQPPGERGWAAQLAAWLARLGPVRFINAGVSGTDSAVAVQRLQAHVLNAAPDLVIVEFGVNDHWLDPAVRERSYEGLLRRLLGAAKPPAVLPLLLTQQGNQARDAVQAQLRLARHYGLTALDAGQWLQRRVDAGQADWARLYDEPVHPNQAGHDAIAAALIETLQAVRTAPAPASASPVPQPLPAPLGDHDHEYPRLLAGPALQPWRQHGFQRGGEVHPEWAALPGGLQPGWVSTADDAEAAFLAWGREIAVFHAESEHYRNLEARVDAGPWVTLQGQVPERRGYLGWHYSVVGRGLEPGAHLLEVRMKRDAWAGSGRPASLLAVMGAGLLPPALHPSDFNARSPAPGADWQLLPPGDAQLQWVGRIAEQPGTGAAPAERLLAWSGSELRARFTGSRLGLRLARANGGISYFTVEIDGHRHVLALKPEGVHDWVLRTPLPPGPHTLRLVKRTEAAMAEARFLGLLLAPGERLLPPPPPRPLRLAFYGDSITAGACNGDAGEDQYEDLSSHDGTRAYGALTAARLGADYLGFAVSGIGITRSWGELLMPQVWNRYAPRLDAPVAASDGRQPDVVLVNLGQNDHGLPASRGEPFAADFAARYLAFVRQLRARYPQARLVLLLGGMSAWQEQPALVPALQAALRTLRAEGDARVWQYTFQAFAWAHPRIDVHARMADELVAFLQSDVLTP